MHRLCFIRFNIFQACDFNLILLCKMNKDEISDHKVVSVSYNIVYEYDSYYMIQNSTTCHYDILR